MFVFENSELIVKRIIFLLCHFFYVIRFSLFRVSCSEHYYYVFPLIAMSRVVFDFCCFLFSKTTTFLILKKAATQTELFPPAKRFVLGRIEPTEMTRSHKRPDRGA